MTRSLLFVLAVAVAGVIDAGHAWAQSGPKSPEQQAADRHFKNGVARFKAKKYVEALAEFERANQISPHPVVLYNIAGCYRELARYPEAVKFYNRFLREGPGRVPAERVADATTELAGIYRLVARLTVQFDPTSDASLFLDNEPIGAMPEDMPLIVMPGDHKLLARAPGRVDAEKALRLDAGDVTTVVLTLAATSDGARPGGTGQGNVVGQPGGTGEPGGTGQPGGSGRAGQDARVGTRPGPDGEIRLPVRPPARATKFLGVSLGFGTNALRVTETGVPSVGLAVALGSRIELGVDATIVAYAVMPAVRVRLAGDALSLHAIAAAPIALTDGDTMEAFVAGAVGLGVRMRVPAMPGLALRLESYVSFAGENHGTTVPTFLGGELWF